MPIVSQESISSGDNQKLRKSFDNYDFAANSKEHLKIVEVTEIELLVISESKSFFSAMRLNHRHEQNTKDLKGDVGTIEIT